MKDYILYSITSHASDVYAQLFDIGRDFMPYVFSSVYVTNVAARLQGLYSLSSKASYHKISELQDMIL